MAGFHGSCHLFKMVAVELNQLCIFAAEILASRQM
ncbi:Uncharacterised protein [Vibrio cholerae]|nr:Uncharacterised protein [Vibrio cholerae]